MHVKIEDFVLKFQESWIFKEIGITFKRHWTKLAPFGNYDSRVESGLWFKELNQLEI